MKKLVTRFFLLLFLGSILFFLIKIPIFFQEETPASKISKPMEKSIDGQIVLTAGDIGDCWSKGTEATETAKLLDKLSGTIITLGDNVYSDGRKENFDNCFEATWGRYKDRIYPGIGNHDTYEGSAAAYFEYFGKNAGDSDKGYYSFNLGDWHLVAVNTLILATPCSSNSVGCKRYSNQMEWLKNDLEKNQTKCTLIYGHHPGFTSQTESISYELIPMWELAYSQNVDLILKGHVHMYERFALQDPKSRLDPKKGIRQFIVGTGGAGLGGYREKAKNIEVINNEKHGILKLILGKGEYEWEFISTDGSFVDKGRDVCH